MYRRSALRQFSSLSPKQLRLPSRLQRHPNGDEVKFYRVAIKRPPFFTRRRITNSLFYAAPLCALWYYGGPIVEVEVLEEEAVKSDGSVEAEEDDEDLEDGWFIPFGWPKKVPKTLYKASDPEWQAYVKLSKDKKKQNDIQVMLAKSIRSEVAKGFGRSLPGVNINKGRYWFWTIYPKGPPQDYQVSGLEIGDEFIAWSTKIMPQKEFQSLSQAMFPYAAMSASWAAFRYQFHMQANKVRMYFGLHPHVDPHTAVIRAHLISAKARTEAKSKSPASKAPASSAPVLGPAQQAAQEASAAASTSQKVNNPVPSDQKEGEIIKKPPFFPQGEQVPMTFTIFMHNLHKNQLKGGEDPPRGCVEVKGTVEVVAKHHHLVLDVIGWYDLQTNKFLKTGSAVREIIPKVVNPAREKPITKR